MKHFVLTLTLFVLIAVCSAAQSGNGAQSDDGIESAAYMVPRLVYVGDPAILILPLPGTFQNSGGVSLPYISLDKNSLYFPRDPNIDFHSIVLERSPQGSRLVVEFTAFMPGFHNIPVIEIGGERFSGLSVQIGSVIDTRLAMTLMGPMPPLAMPGTALMLYGSITALVLTLAASLWFTVKGRRYLQSWTEKFKQWQLFIYMKGMEKRLRKAMQKGGNKRAILDILCEKFRLFLSFFTGRNCRAMTARELANLQFPENTENNSVFLGKFFHRLDELRFSGSEIAQDDVFKLLADLRVFLTEIENSKNGKAA